MPIELTSAFLEKQDFGELASLCQQKVDEWKDTAQGLEYVTELINEERSNVDDKKLAKYHASLSKIKKLTEDINEIIDILIEKAMNSREEKMIEKAKERFENLKEQYKTVKEKSCLDKINIYISRRKTHVMDAYSYQNPDTMLVTPDLTVGDPELGQENVFDQEEIIKERDEKINQINLEAQELRDIARDVHEVIEKSDKKMDVLNNK